MQIVFQGHYLCKAHKGRGEVVALRQHRLGEFSELPSPLAGFAQILAFRALLPKNSLPCLKIRGEGPPFRIRVRAVFGLDAVSSHRPNRLSRSLIRVTSSHSRYQRSPARRSSTSTPTIQRIGSDYSNCRKRPTSTISPATRFSELCLENNPYTEQIRPFILCRVSARSRYASGAAGRRPGSTTARRRGRRTTSPRRGSRTGMPRARLR